MQMVPQQQLQGVLAGSEVQSDLCLAATEVPVIVIRRDWRIHVRQLPGGGRSIIQLQRLATRVGKVAQSVQSPRLPGAVAAKAESKCIRQ